MASTTIDISMAGETLTLTPERAAVWAAGSTVFVADVHLGKAAALRSMGLHVPRGTTAGDLGRLSTVLTRSRARRLVVLGDLLHAAAGVGVAASRWKRWRQQHADVEVVLVPGNHDWAAGIERLGSTVEVARTRVELGPFCCAHDPAHLPAAPGGLAGHIHPGFDLGGPGGDRLRGPAYWINGARLILPAFSMFTGYARRPNDGERIVAISDHRLFDLGARRAP